MLISLKNDLAVLAMPKTGTTSIEAALAPHCDISFTGNPVTKHMPVRKYGRFIRPYLASIGHDQVKTTCLFRHPVDWLASWYRYRQREALKGHKNSTADISFDEFATSYMSEKPEAFAKLGRQSTFVTDKDGKVAIDTLFRYENFESFTDFLQKQFACKLDFDRLNESKAGGTSIENATRKRLEGYLSPEFEIYDSIEI